jgi:hypothetical protein
MSDDKPNDMGAEAMRDDSTVLQNAKVGAPAPQVSAEGRRHLETTLADVAHIPPTGLTDEDVRRLEHPGEFPTEKPTVRRKWWRR